MNKLLSLIILAVLAACASNPKNNEDEKFKIIKPKIITPPKITKPPKPKNDEYFTDLKKTTKVKKNQLNKKTKSLKKSKKPTGNKNKPEVLITIGDVVVENPNAHKSK